MIRPELLQPPESQVFFPSEQDRLLQQEDFPAVKLTVEQKRRLQRISITHVVLDHNKQNLAQIQADFIREQASYFKDLSVLYATNGDTSIDAKTLQRPALPNHLGVPDLIASATQQLLQNVLKNEEKWFIFSSADVWMLNPQKWLQYLADASLQHKQLVTSYCGGLGLSGALQLKEYYMTPLRPASLVHATRAQGLMTEFFAIRPELAANTLATWNGGHSDPKMVYENYHADNRVQPYVSAGRGVVEAHFRYMMTRVLGMKFSKDVCLMHPPPPKKRFRITPPYVYPIGTGYTSTHDDSVRKMNVLIAKQYGFTSESSHLATWLSNA